MLTLVDRLFRLLHQTHAVLVERRRQVSRHGGHVAGDALLASLERDAVDADAALQMLLAAAAEHVQPVQL